MRATGSAHQYLQNIYSRLKHYVVWLAIGYNNQNGEQGTWTK